MFPFWGPVISPLLRAAGARSVVEVGALRGENTRQILEALGDGSVLHVIDPVPAFDPAEHVAAFGDRYVFHQALSLDVLGTLPAMDAALIDGDHNWYTVYNELRLLREVSRSDGRPLPVLVLHDVSWPYGRRDLYYDPETIPSEHRQPMRKAGLRPGQKRVVDEGGLSSSHWHAVEEGGPHNGVMTALDDFLAEHDRPYRMLVLPVYFGLAIVVEEDRFASTPGLDDVWKSLESAATKDRLMELGELLRLRAVTQHHTVTARHRSEHVRTTERYLELVVRSLVDDIYPENELRIEHLLDCIDKGNAPNEALLRDPARAAATSLEALRGRRQAGAPGPVGSQGFDPCLEPGGRATLDALAEALDSLDADGVPGDAVVVGAGAGGAAVYVRAHLEVAGPADRKLWVADPLRAGDSIDLNRIRDALHRFDLLDDRVRILQGDPESTVGEAPIGSVSLVHIGPPGGAEVDAGTVLHRLAGNGKMSPGALVVVDGRNDAKVAAQVDEFLTAAGVTVGRSPIGGGGWTWRIEERLDPAVARTETSKAGRAGAPLAVPSTDPVDLSVVVVFYDMAREARRTLHSLSRAYQRDLGDLSYEVIVVENGSSPEQRLGEELVRSFGPEFRYIDRGPDADPSPTTALNAGIAEARGDAVALMIDGAHVLTPRVLHYGMAGLAAYGPAVVATQAWYVGPGQQGELMEAGYDQSREDELFEGIGWPGDGYRLFDIGHIAGDRDWLDGLWESNCIFVTRRQLEQVGGFDESFSMPGGGYANLDLYERLGAAPDVSIVTILGEGSFHQVHGGTTTNQSDPEERRRRVHGYAEHYAELRGRPFVGPEKPVLYVGAFRTQGSRRTRARRMTGSAFEVDRRIEGIDGPGSGPLPMPEEVRDSFVAAYWRTRAWRKGRWLGNTVANAPTDLFAYQEIVTEVRPAWIVETGGRDGGRALFLASVCDLIDHGQVLSVGAAEDHPTHPRVTWVDGSVTRPEVAEQVRSIVGDDPRAFVILGTRGKRNRMEAEFEALAPLVAVGSYVVIEHTVLNGRPVDASFGPGPFEAMRRILLRHGEFAVDTARENQSLTFNPHGFLRRTR
ncbi:MAG: class I SAM-dependent methyltransferase [Acidimicrobiales bacterium]|nr:class I SAM-dependent methyltransferase [Acidimicrobiales bacterium]